jgi:hypothetical protein
MCYLLVAVKKLPLCTFCFLFLSELLRVCLLCITFRWPQQGMQLFVELVVAIFYFTLLGL